jgi:threonine dehydrogenase-like Zn-dependent dehydrogenase
VRGLKEGQKIAVRPSVVCGQCANCRSGNSDNCTQRKGIGVSRDGALASHVRVPAENCIRVPQTMPIEIAALTEPMTVCAESVDNAAIKPGERVLVLGPGNIGQGAALFARAAGAHVTIVGKDDAPRIASLQRMGFDDVVDLGERSLNDALASHLAQGKFDAVIEATGVPPVVQQGLDVLKKRGIFVAVGIQPKPVTINLTRLVREHQQIRGSYRSPIPTWRRVVDFLDANTEIAREMISHRLPLERAIEGLELSRTKAASKVMIVGSE